jgi:hypothetical protein
MRSISFNDERVKDAVLQRAVQMFRRMGGIFDEHRPVEPGSEENPSSETDDGSQTNGSAPIQSDDPRVAELERMLPPPIRAGEPRALTRTIVPVTRRTEETAQ